MENFELNNSATINSKLLSETQEFNQSIWNINVKKERMITIQNFIEEINNNQINQKQLTKKQDELGEFVFEFQVSVSDNYKYLIRKTYRDFQKLDKQLKDEIPKSQYENLSIQSIPKNQKEIQSRIILNFFEKYLTHLVQTHVIISLSFVRRFLQISQYSNKGQKIYKECFMNKRAGGRFNESSCVRWGVFCGRWDKRYFTISSEGISYKASPDDKNLKENILFDTQFRVFNGKLQTNYETGILLYSSQRKLLITADNFFEYLDFLYCIHKAAYKSIYNKQHNFASFAPERQNCYCKAYVDGEEYFKDLHDILVNRAKKSIFITDWWLSPQLYLKRPVSKELNQESRLDRVLLSCAKRGVKIYILHWQEHKLIGIANNSQYTKQNLENLHQNIKIFTHPNYILPYEWSHHEKMVIIDQKTGFLGGLDLCYGRWDTEKHLLIDANDHLNKDSKYFPGIEFSNVRIKDFSNVQKYEQSGLNRETQYRMPWHDIGIQVVGEIVVDMSRHFIQYWNHALVDIQHKNRHDIMQIQNPSSFLTTIKNKFSNSSQNHQKFQQLNNLAQQQQQQQQQKSENNSYFDRFYATVDQDEQYLNSFQVINIKGVLQIEKSDKLIIQKQLSINDEHEEKKQSFVKQESQKKGQSKLIRLGTSNLNQFDKNQNESLKKKKMTKSFIQDPNYILDEDFYNILLKVKQQKEQADEKERVEEEEQKQLEIVNEKEFQKQIQQFQEDESLQIENRLKFKGLGTCTIQMVRSASKWSIGVNKTENSIQNAYIHLISLAEHFIYIENQFFISSLAGEQVQNQIAQSLVTKIIQMKNQNKKFRVIVVMPLIPGFTGEIDDKESTTMKIQLHWEYQTICRGENSVYKKLEDAGITEPIEYISFYGLRTHAKVNNVPVTEEIYVHSKLMIVDDQKVIVGSANINDRSLLGNRDSEIAMIIEDTNAVGSKMNGESFKARKFAFELRNKIFQEHFGLNQDQLNDPLDDTTFNKIRQQTLKNTEIYRMIFKCYPDDNIHQISELRQFVSEKQLNKYDELAPQIIGNAVTFPLYFMDNDNLDVKFYQKESLVKTIIFI